MGESLLKVALAAARITEDGAYRFLERRWISKEWKEPRYYYPI